MGNSSYGKLLENPDRYTRAKLVLAKRMYFYLRKHNLQSWHQLETESNDVELNEVVLSLKKVNDSLPVHVGNAVLQHSKLHFIRYV